MLSVCFPIVRSDKMHLHQCMCICFDLQLSDCTLILHSHTKHVFSCILHSYVVLTTGVNVGFDVAKLSMDKAFFMVHNGAFEGGT